MLSAVFMILARQLNERPQDGFRPAVRILDPLRKPQGHSALQPGDEFIFRAEVTEETALADLCRVRDGIKRESCDTPAADQALGCIRDPITGRGWGNVSQRSTRPASTYSGSRCPVTASKMCSLYAGNS